MKLKSIVFACACFSYMNFYAAEDVALKNPHTSNECHQKVACTPPEDESITSQEKFVQSVRSGNSIIFQLRLFGSAVKFITGWPVDKLCNLSSSIMFGKNIYDATKPIVDKVGVAVNKYVLGNFRNTSTDTTDRTAQQNSNIFKIENLKSIINIGMSSVLPIILYMKNSNCDDLIFYNTTLSIIRNTKFFSNNDPYLKVADSAFFGIKLLSYYFYGFGNNFVFRAYNTIKQYVFARSLYFMYKASSQIFQNEAILNDGLFTKANKRQVTNAMFLLNTLSYTYKYFSFIGLDMGVVSSVVLTLLYDYVIYPAYNNIVENFLSDFFNGFDTNKNKEASYQMPKDQDNTSLLDKICGIFTNTISFIATKLFSEISNKSETIYHSMNDRFSKTYQYFYKTIQQESAIN